MDAGIGEAAAVASIASAGFGASSSVMKGAGTQAADEMQSARLTRAAEFGKMNANLADVSLREDLNTRLGNIDSIRAAARIDPSSPTSAVIREHETEVSDRQRTAKLISIRSQTDEELASADYLKKAGDYALLQGFMSAGADISKAAVMGLNRPKAAA